MYRIGVTDGSIIDDETYETLDEAVEELIRFRGHDPDEVVVVEAGPVWAPTHFVYSSQEEADEDEGDGAYADRVEEV